MFEALYICTRACDSSGYGAQQCLAWVLPLCTPSTLAVIHSRSDVPSQWRRAAQGRPQALIRHLPPLRPLLLRLRPNLLTSTFRATSNLRGIRMMRPITSTLWDLVFLQSFACLKTRLDPLYSTQTIDDDESSLLMRLLLSTSFVSGMDALRRLQGEP